MRLRSYQLRSKNICLSQPRRVSTSPERKYRIVDRVAMDEPRRRQLLSLLASGTCASNRFMMAEDWFVTG